MTDRRSKDMAEDIASGLRPRTNRGGMFNATFLVLLLLCSVVVNVLLAHRVSGLRNAIDEMKSEGRLQVGTNVPPIEGQSVDGASQTLNYADASVPTVLYVFTPQCGWCKKNIDNLRMLISNSGSSYRIVGVSLTRQDLKEYIEKEHLKLPVYTDISEPTKLAYRVGGTPETIVVSPQSKVLKVWLGVYQDEIRQEIDNYLNVHLPGNVGRSKVSWVISSLG